MGRNVIFYGDVEIGEKSIIQDNVIIGIKSKASDEMVKVRIGSNATIRSGTVIYSNVNIGENFKTGHNVLIREKNVIGDNVSIGSHSVVERDNRIGNNVRIHSNCFIPEFVIIEDNVWISPCVTILNVLHPPCPKFEECAKYVHVKRNAKIGGGVVIGPRITIGENSFIGMGSVVTKDIPPNVVAYGNPAKVVKRIDEMECKLGVFERPYEWEEMR